MTTDPLRQALERNVAEAQEALRLYDLACTPGPHEAGCQCARVSCTMARVTPIRLEPDEYEAFMKAMEDFQ